MENLEVTHTPAEVNNLETLLESLKAERDMPCHNSFLDLHEHVGQQMLELVDGQGLIIVKALGIPAAHTAQDVFLVEGFHTLHNDGQAHHASHVHDGLQNADALLPRL